MCLPASDFDQLIQGRSIGALEQLNHLGLLAVFSCARCFGIGWRSGGLCRWRAGCPLAWHTECVVALGCNEPVAGALGDEGSVEQAIEDFLTRTAFDVFGEPFNLASRVLVGVGKDGLLGGCELCAHVNLRLMC